MPLVVYVQQAETCPVFMCDWCKKPIEKAEDGVAVYPDYDPSEGTTFLPLFAHQGMCHDRLESRIEPMQGYGGWQPLNFFIYWLVNNCKYEPLANPPYSLPGE